MHSGVGSTKLMTKPPNLRMRALQKKHPELSEEDIKNTYANGVPEQYMNRPKTPSREEVEEDGTVARDFETMLYPDFHKFYQVKRYKTPLYGGNDRRGLCPKI